MSNDLPNVQCPMPKPYITSLEDLFDPEDNDLPK